MKNTGSIYNTGKVEIGKYYQPPRRYESSLDMDRLQLALISKRKPKYWPWAVYALASLVILFVATR